MEGIDTNTLVEEKGKSPQGINYRFKREMSYFEKQLVGKINEIVEYLNKNTDNKEE